MRSRPVGLPRSFPCEGGRRQDRFVRCPIKPAGFNPSRRYPVSNSSTTGRRSSRRRMTLPADDQLDVEARKASRSSASWPWSWTAAARRCAPRPFKTTCTTICRSSRSRIRRRPKASLASLPSWNRPAGRVRPFLWRVYGHEGDPWLSRLLQGRGGQRRPYDMYGDVSAGCIFAIRRFSRECTPAPRRLPSNWGNVDLTQQAGRLKGKLMLAYGDLDENAFRRSAPHGECLDRPNKEFDLIYMPNRSHSFSGGAVFHSPHSGSFSFAICWAPSRPKIMPLANSPSQESRS